MAKVVITIPNGGGGGISIPHNELDGLQGNGPDYFHLDENEKEAIENLVLNPIPNAQQVFEQGSVVNIPDNILLRSELLSQLSAVSGLYSSNIRSEILQASLNHRYFDEDNNINNGANIEASASDTEAIVNISASRDGLGSNIQLTDYSGIIISDSYSLAGLKYNIDYTMNQLSDDRSITDVGGVKQLISTEVDLSNVVKLTGETSQSIEGDIIFEGNAIGNLTPTNNNHLVRKDYVDGLLTSIIRLAGDWDASSGTYPIVGTGTAGAIRRGDSYITSVAGIINGQEYGIGDSFYAKVNNPGQTPFNWARYEVPATIGTPTTAGIVKLYTTTGTATDGTMDQNSITNALNTKGDIKQGGNAFGTVMSIGTNDDQAVSFKRNNVVGFSLEAGNTIRLGANWQFSSATGTQGGSLFLGNASIPATMNKNVSGTNIGFILDALGTTTGDIINFRNSGTTRAGVRIDGRVFGANATANNDYVTLQQLNSGTSAVIAQTITDGVTTSAPSQDAVFDALVLKANDNNVLHTNNTNETKIGSIISQTGFIADGGVLTSQNSISDNRISIQSSGTVSNIQGANFADTVGMKISLNRFGGEVGVGKIADNGIALDVNGTGKFSGQLTIPNASISTSAIPLGQADSRYLRQSNFTAGVQPLTTDGVTATYSFPHGLSTIPRVVILTRGEADDFTVFKTTWDADDVIVEFSGAPTAGTINLNWFAVI